MYAGKMIAVDTPLNIRSRVQGDLIQIYPQDQQAASDLIAALPGICEVQTYGEALHILVDSGKKRLPKIKAQLRKHDIPYTNARVAPIRMEEAFVSFINQLDAESEPAKQQAHSGTR